MLTGKILIGLVTVVLVAVLIACAPAAAPTSAPATSAPATSAPAAQATTAPTAAATAATAGEKTTIVYLSMFSQGESYADVLDKATKDFMAENPDIDVKINWAGRTNLTQLQSLLAAGTQVDIVD